MECLQCENGGSRVVHERTGVPVDPGALHPTAFEARECQRQDIRWWRCEACGDVHAEALGELWEIGDDELVAADAADDDLDNTVCDWVAAWTDTMSCWEEHVDEMLAEGCRIVVWGTSPAAAAFLDRFGVYVLAVVDPDPQRQGQFVAGTAHPVIAPESLVAIDPQVVLTASKELVDEVEEITTELGLYAQVRDL